MRDIILDISLYAEAYEMIFKKLLSWVRAFALMIPNFITAILIFITFSLIAKFVKKVLHRILLRTSISEDIIIILTRIVAVIIILVGVFFCLGILQLEKTVTSLLAGAGIIGLALSFAFQDIATNLISGFIIAVKKPFKVGDHIETNNFIGTVSAVDIRAIHLKTFDGQEIIIPSKDVLQKPIKNFHTFGERRIEFTIGISYNEDLEKVANLAQATLEKVTGRDPNKNVEVYFDTLNETSINLILKLWVNLAEHKNVFLVKHNAIIDIQKAFKENDIAIPLTARVREEFLASINQAPVLKLEKSNL